MEDKDLETLLDPGSILAQYDAQFSSYQRQAAMLHELNRKLKVICVLWSKLVLEGDEAMALVTDALGLTKELDLNPLDENLQEWVQRYIQQTKGGVK